VAPGTIFALFAGVYYWYPKATGRQMNEFLGKLHFWPSLIFMNGIFFPMLIQGMAGMQRRLWDGGEYYAHAQSVTWLHEVISISAWCLGLAQIPFILNFFLSLRKPREAGDNPWHATTIEWAAPSPPPHGNFATTPVAYRAPYEYSVPGMEEDYLPQFVLRGEPAAAEPVPAE
jgi:cytochrome c oxidase subunit 1